jgi:hypothetical protein
MRDTDDGFSTRAIRAVRATRIGDPSQALAAARAAAAVPAGV